MTSSKQLQLEQIIEPAVTACGYELLGLEVHQSSGQCLLRIYIDKPTGITIDDCETASRQIGSVLEVENIMSDRYTLEVSSPGLDRPLFKLEHYEQFIGHQIKLRLNMPVEGQRNFSGILKRVEGEKIFIENQQGEIGFLHGQIDKAKLVPQFD